MSLPDERRSGVLLHPTSLPGPWGIGELGPEAIRWLDALQEMGQSAWQVLPLGPTGYGDSPYQSFSSFAANDLLLSFDWLREWGLLNKADLQNFPAVPPLKVDYGRIIPLRQFIHSRAASRFDAHASPELQSAYRDFVGLEHAWLEDYCLFRVIKNMQQGRPWTHWPSELRDRDSNALEQIRTEQSPALLEMKRLQFLTDFSWQRIRLAARKRGILLVGDIPIFVAADSADVWTWREGFKLDDNGQPRVVAGVPPDCFSETGQRWGNPVYDWPEHRTQGYTWWLRRLRKMFDWFDQVRIDHFLGFHQYYEIPTENETAETGEWVDGPGADFFLAVQGAMGESPPIIAEDLGLITPPVVALRERFHFPGMRIFQFSFGADAKSVDGPDGWTANTVAYSGTHDNDTLLGWVNRPPTEREPVATIKAEHMRMEKWLPPEDSLHPDFRWRMIGCVLQSKCRLAVIPLQDVIGLGTEARMNLPGNPDGNWQWRFKWEQLEPADRTHFTKLTKRAERK